MWMYIKRLLVSLDQLLNVICGGYEDETVSSRLHRKSDTSTVARYLRDIVDTIFFFDTITVDDKEVGHCHKSYLYELKRMDLPPSMRDAQVC